MCLVWTRGLVVSVASGVSSGWALMCLWVLVMSTRADLWLLCRQVFIVLCFVCPLAVSVLCVSVSCFRTCSACVYLSFLVSLPSQVIGLSMLAIPLCARCFCAGGHLRPLLFLYLQWADACCSRACCMSRCLFCLISMLDVHVITGTCFISVYLCPWVPSVK